MQQQIQAALQAQRSFFAAGRTRDIDARLAALKKLRQGISAHRERLSKAVYDDFRKPEPEFFFTEMATTISELDLHIKKVRRWSKRKRVSTSMMQQMGRSYIYPEPYGQTLVISPWNYPFYLLICPLIGALSGGNTAVLKPSPATPHLAQAVSDLIAECFPPDYVTTFQGNRDVNQLLLQEKWDLIFFTGSPSMGRVVMRAAAENLTPVILELGGKSPCIVHSDADLKIAAKHIAWGKYLNAGQTCIAPDYLYVHRDVKQPLLEKMKACIKQFYGDDPQASPDLTRIVSQHHAQRLEGLMHSGEIVHGGKAAPEQCYIEPTIMDRITPDDPIMQEEIFGPLLPVMEYSDLSEVIGFINSRPKPLALYLFTNDSAVREKVLDQTSSGGCAVNDTILHIAGHSLPFGGVGNSGMGQYHGKATFDAFTHYKSVLVHSNLSDPPVRYAPYKPWQKKAIQFLMTGKLGEL